MIRIDLRTKKVVWNDATVPAAFGLLALLVVFLFFQSRNTSVKQVHYHAMSIEERELVYSVVERLERHSKLQAFTGWLDQALRHDSVAVLVSNSKHGKTVELGSEGILIFSEKFFGSDPIAQEISLVAIIQGNSNSTKNSSANSELARHSR